MLALALLLHLALGADSVPALKRCETPKPPLGSLHSAGTVSFVVSRQGKADLSSVVVEAVSDGTAPGLRSAVQRQLVACRFAPARASGHADSARVQVHVGFAPDSIIWGAVALAPPNLGAVDSPKAAHADTVDFTDPQLEERPLAWWCRQWAPRDEVVIKQRVDGQIVEPLVPSAGAAPLAHGDVLLRYVVSPLGKVDGASVVVVQAPTPAHAAAARARVTSCHWSPGRIAGDTVAVRIAGRERF